MVVGLSLLSGFDARRIVERLLHRCVLTYRFKEASSFGTVVCNRVHCSIARTPVE